jgi:hypothetical protein
MGEEMKERTSIREEKADRGEGQKRRVEGGGEVMKENSVMVYFIC